MSLSAKLRPHQLTPQATLCASGFNLVGADSPAIEAMTDFGRVTVVAIGGSARLDEANTTMISRGVRLLMVTDRDDQVQGLLTARDLQGERPLQILQARGGRHEDLTVADIMTPISRVDALRLDEVLHARVIDVLEALKAVGRQHILVEDTDPATGLPRVRGLFSATHMGRLLGVPVLGFDLPRTFAEIEAALAG